MTVDTESEPGPKRQRQERAVPRGAVDANGAKKALLGRDKRLG